MQKVKCVILGDRGVGKNCIWQTFCNKEFSDYRPLCSDYYPTVMVNDVPFELHGSVVPAHDDFVRIRPLSYPLTDVFLFCFSISDPGSLESLHIKWHQEIIQHCGIYGYNIIVVGLKRDLRSDSSTMQHLSEKQMSHVTYKQGRTIAKNMKAKAYMECSALQLDGLDEVFEAVITYRDSSVSRQEGAPCWTCQLL